MTRTKKFKKSKPRIFIFVEGKTEQKYFEILKQKLRLSSTGIDILKLDNTGNDWVDKAAIHIENNPRFNRDGNNPVYLVFDKDNLSLAAFEKLQHKAHDKAMQIVFSNIDFEVWLLAHFEKLTAGQLSKKLLMTKLTKYIGRDYQKAEIKQLEKIVKDYRKAIENAKRIAKIVFDRQCTNVGTMIGEIENIEYIKLSGEREA